MPIYMKVDGIEGPVTGKYKGWIELETCQIGVSDRVTSERSRGDSIWVNELGINKRPDSASHALYNLYLGGKAKKVTIDFLTDNGQRYMEIELDNALVSSYGVTAHGSGTKIGPLESLSIAYSKIIYRVFSIAPNPAAARDKAKWQMTQ